MQRSPLLPILGILLIGIAPIIFFLKINDSKYNPDYITDPISTKAKLEAKKDSIAKDSSGNEVSFIYVSYGLKHLPKNDSIKINTNDSAYLDSVAALKRMLIAENFKVELPELKFAEIEASKNTIAKLHEGDSVKIVYSRFDPEHVRLEEENNAPIADKTKSSWITICIISFMAGIWLLIMNKRRRAQGQESDPLSSMNFYSSIKKDEGAKTGGRP